MDEARRAGSRPIAASVAPLGGDACAVSIETDHADVGRTAYLIDVPPSGYPSPVKRSVSASFDGFDTRLSSCIPVALIATQCQPAFPEKTRQTERGMSGECIAYLALTRSNVQMKYSHALAFNLIRP